MRLPLLGTSQPLIRQAQANSPKGKEADLGCFGWVPTIPDRRRPACHTSTGLSSHMFVTYGNGVRKQASIAHGYVTTYIGYIGYVMVVTNGYEI